MPTVQIMSNLKQSDLDIRGCALNSNELFKAVVNGLFAANPQIHNYM